MRAVTGPYSSLRIARECPFSGVTDSQARVVSRSSIRYSSRILRISLARGDKLKLAIDIDGEVLSAPRHHVLDDALRRHGYLP